MLTALRCKRRYGTRSCVVLTVRRDGAAELTERFWKAAEGGDGAGAWRTQTQRFRMAAGADGGG